MKDHIRTDLKELSLPILSLKMFCFNGVAAQVIRGLSGRVIQHPPPKKGPFWGGYVFLS